MRDGLYQQKTSQPFPALAHRGLFLWQRFE
jgi:hypothetical protein